MDTKTTGEREKMIDNTSVSLPDLDVTIDNQEVKVETTVGLDSNTKPTVEVTLSMSF